MSAQEINDWAFENYQSDSVDYEDWESNEEYSVINEILAKLDMMDMNLTTTDDIPAFLQFLETPIGEFQKGYAELEKYLNSVNYKQRQASLSGTEPYDKFC